MVEYPIHNMTTQATNALQNLANAINKRQRNIALKQIAIEFIRCTRANDFATAEVLGEKLNNYGYDVSSVA